MIALLISLLLAQYGNQTENQSVLRPPLGVVLRAALNPGAAACYSAPGLGMNETVTFTRGTAAMTPITASSGMVSCLSNNMREDPNGYLAEPQTTNSCQQSQTFDNATWVKVNVTVTANTNAGPDGTTTADTLVGTGSGGTCSGNQITATAVPYTGSVWLEATTGTQAATVAVHDYTSVSDLCTSGSVTTTTTWQRFGCEATATSSHSIGLVIYPGTASGTGTVIAWGAQLETSTYPTSYAVTVAAAAAHNTDTAYVTNPITAQDPGWCVAVNYLPPPTAANLSNGNSWALENLSQGLWEMSSGTHNGPNTAYVFVKSGGTVALVIVDTSSATKTYTIPQPSAGSHRVTFCQDGAANVTSWVDSTSQTVTPSGTGTGIMSSVPSRFYLGILSTTLACGGQIRNLAVSRLDTTYVGANL